jgi:hypothetical protein
VKHAAEVVVIGVVGVALYAILYPVCTPPREGHVRKCTSVLKQLGVGFQIYAYDFNDRLPVEKWADTTMPYSKNEELYHCFTRENPGGRYGYAMNLAVRGRGLLEVDDAVLLFETDARARNVMANLAAQNKSRHERGGAQVTVGGQASFVRE